MSDIISIRRGLSASRTSARGAFTAVELVVVMGIMLMLTAMATPSVVTSLRRGAVHASANDVIDCWRQARRLAMDQVVIDPPSDAQPMHYGLLLVQKAGERAYAAVVYDNRTADDIAAGAGVSSSARGSSAEIVTKHQLKRTIRVAIGRAGDAPSELDGAILVYAQYGTGLPIDASDVIAGHGPSAAPVGLGIAGRPELGIPASPIATRLRLQTVDFAETPKRRGHAVDVALYPVGVMAALDG